MLTIRNDEVSYRGQAIGGLEHVRIGREGYAEDAPACRQCGWQFDVADLAIEFTDSRGRTDLYCCRQCATDNLALRMHRALQAAARA